MQSVSAPVWAGRILSGIAIAFLLFDAVGKLMRVAPVVEGTAKLGYPDTAVVQLGVILLVGVALYAFPRTSLLGAIYLAGYLGGAVATHVLFPVYVAAFVWGGLALRNPKLMSLLSGTE